MIIPANRLLWIFTGAFLPVSLAWAFAPQGLLGPTVLAGLLGLFALTDAWRARSCLAGIQIEAAERTNLTHDREGSLDFVVSGNLLSNTPLRIGLALPAGFSSPWADCQMTLDGEAKRQKVVWPLTPAKRGQFVFSNCYMQARSPFGLWIRQERRELSTNVHVYPNLFKDQKHLAALFLNRGLLGLHLQRQVGRGKEFEKLREYLPGDSLTDIHWRATAKRNQLVTKEYRIERTQEIYVVIDSSRLSARDSNGQAVLERYITAALVLQLVAQQQGDLFGLVTFSNQIHSFVRAKAGKPHFRVCQDALINLQPHRVNPDFGELASFVGTRLRRRSLLVVLTALDESALAEQFEKDLAIVNRQHLVLVSMLKPQAAQPLFSETQIEHSDQIYNSLGGHMIWQNLRELGKRLKVQGVDFHQLDHEKLCVELISQYLNVKRRQLL